MLIGRCGFVNSFDRVEDSGSDNIQEIIFLGRGLMWNNAAVCGGRIDLKILVRDSYYMWKSLQSKSGMMFADPLMCW